MNTLRFFSLLLLCPVALLAQPQFSLQPGIDGVAGETWTARESVRDWVSIASSGDGSRLAALESMGNAYFSSDFGETWSAGGPVAGLKGIALADNGLIQVTGGNGTPIYVSEDGGGTWAARGPVKSWHCFAVSADGSRMIAGDEGPDLALSWLYLSTDAGQTWSATTMEGGWKSVAVSADGMKMAAVKEAVGQIFLSTDGGVVWTPAGAELAWKSVTLSRDGGLVAAVAEGNPVHLSSDGGQTWTTGGPSLEWRALACSGDGTTMLAAANNNTLYRTVDAGETWSAKGASQAWTAVAGSADGNRLVAAASAAQLYTSVGTQPLHIDVFKNSGAYSYVDLAVGIRNSADDGSPANVAFVLTASNPALFSAGPVLTPEGDLTFTPAPEVSGRSLVAVVLRDLDTMETSAPQYFTVEAEDNLPPTDIRLTSQSVPENTASPALVGHLQAVDGNGDADTYIFQMLASPDFGAFSMNGHNVYLQPQPNFEIKPTYQLSLRVTDTAGLSFEKTFTISIADVPEAPSTLTLSHSTVREGSGTNAWVGVLELVDEDQNETGTFGLVAGAGDGDNASFEILGGTLFLIPDAVFATQNTYQLRIRGTDSTGLFIEQPLTVTIAKRNTPPANVALSTNTLPENNVPYAVVGLLSALDEDGPSPLIYSLEAEGVDNSRFQIIRNQLLLRESADFETRPSYSLKVLAYDGEDATEIDLPLNVTDVNEAPTDLLFTSTADWSSHPANGPIGTLSATDQDAGSSIVFSPAAGVGSGDNAFFSTSGNQLILTVPPGSEKTSYSLRLQAADGQGGVLERTFTFMSGIVNAPPSFSLPQVTLGNQWKPFPMNGSWAAITSSADGTFIAAANSQGESGGQIHRSTDGGDTWSEHGPFRYDWRELVCSSDGTRLAAIVSGTSGIFLSEDSGVTWTPAGASQYWRDIAMSADGTKLAAIGGTDFYTNQIYTSTDFGATWTARGEMAEWSSIASSADGTRLIAAENFGYLHTSSDGGETWTSGLDYGFWRSVSSSADGLHLVACNQGDFPFLSHDGGQTWVVPGLYISPLKSCISADGTRLVIIGSNFTEGEFDFPLINGASLYVSLDSGATWSSLPPPLGLNEFDGLHLTADGQQLLGFDYRKIYRSTSSGTYEVAVGGNSGSHTLTPFATDIASGPPGEPAQNVRFILTNDDPSLFAIQPAMDPAGQLTFTLAPDAHGSTQVSVVAMDDAGGADTSAPQEFIITVQRNAAPDGIFLESDPFAENQEPNAQAGILYASDPDFEQEDRPENIQFSLSAGEGDESNPHFLIQNGNTLVFNGIADFETQAEYTIRIRATDLGGAWMEEVFTVTVEDVNDAPVFALPAGAPGLPGETWTPVLQESVHSIASSADGATLLSIGYRDIYLSRDAGTSWGLVSLPGQGRRSEFRSVACSADGQRLFVSGGKTFYASTDAGLTWTAHTAAWEWGTIACSADGARVMGISYEETGFFPVSFIQLSTDAGATWTPISPAGLWGSLATSADGTRLIASQDYLWFSEENTGGIWISLDAGQTWTKTGLDGSARDLYSSADGNRLAVIRYNTEEEFVLISENGGATWTPSGLPRLDWRAIAGSADGSQLAIVADQDDEAPGFIYLSRNAGFTWVRKNAPRAYWSDIASSADGNRLAAVTEYQENANNASIFTATHLKLPGITVELNSAAWQQANFAKGILPAPLGELTQTVTLELQTNREELFSVLPAIDPAGTLTFTPAPGAYGTATVIVTALDDGSTEMPGDRNRSAAQTFTIHLRGGPELIVRTGEGPPLVSGESVASFGGTATGSTSTITFTLENPGSIDLTNLFVEPDRNWDGSGFSTELLEGTLTAGGSRTLTVSFAPETTGLRRAGLLIYGGGENPVGPFLINLTGTGLTVLDHWREETFGGATANTGDNDDFDQDGLPNLLEFAFGTGAADNNSGTDGLGYSGALAGGGTITAPGTPITLFETAVTGVDFRAIFIRRSDHVNARLIYTPQFSSTLGVWQNSTATPTVLSDNGTVQVVSVPYTRFIAGKKARFFRIRVDVRPDIILTE